MTQPSRSSVARQLGRSQRQRQKYANIFTHAPLADLMKMVNASSLRFPFLPARASLLEADGFPTIRRSRFASASAPYASVNKFSFLVLLLLLGGVHGVWWLPAAVDVDAVRVCWFRAGQGFFIR